MFPNCNGILKAAETVATLGTSVGERITAYNQEYKSRQFIEEAIWPICIETVLELEY